MMLYWYRTHLTVVLSNQLPVGTYQSYKLPVGPTGRYLLVTTSRYLPVTTGSYLPVPVGPTNKTPVLS